MRYYAKILAIYLVSPQKSQKYIPQYVRCCHCVYGNTQIFCDSILTTLQICLCATIRKRLVLMRQYAFFPCHSTSNYNSIITRQLSVTKRIREECIYVVLRNLESDYAALCGTWNLIMRRCAELGI